MFSSLAKDLKSHRVLYLVMYTVLRLTFVSGAAQEPTATAMASATQPPDGKIQTAPVVVEGVTLFMCGGGRISQQEDGYKKLQNEPRLWRQPVLSLRNRSGYRKHLSERKSWPTASLS